MENIITKQSTKQIKKTHIYSKEYWEKHLSWTKQNL